MPRDDAGEQQDERGHTGDCHAPVKQNGDVAQQRATDQRDIEQEAQRHGGAIGQRQQQQAADQGHGRVFLGRTFRVGDAMQMSAVR